jgi:hypothetical protein
MVADAGLFWEKSTAGWFVLREKYCWLVTDKPSEQGVRVNRRTCMFRAHTQHKCTQATKQSLQLPSDGDLNLLYAQLSLCSMVNAD